MQRDLPTSPAIRFKNAQEESLKFALRLTRARERFVVRLTGGCGLMSATDAQGLYDLFREAFAGYGGAILFGGTRMISRNEPQTIVPGITEVGPVIREHCPGSFLQGVVPRTEEFHIDEGGRLVISQESGNDYVTIAHPNQDTCLVVQKSVDDEVLWDAEYQECLRIIGGLRDYVGWRSLLVSYNGGGVTKKEILATAELGWPVLLIEGSGRTTDDLASDLGFLARYPHVNVTTKHPVPMRKALINLGAINDTQADVRAGVSTEL